MGVISRRVLPACGSLCFYCPSLRARSRQPVKRYKKLLSSSFPRNQDGDPNERMISKLCEYASKNPMRIPEITNYLEQRLQKELNNERFAFAKVVPCVYRKLLTSCKEQMALYAPSMLVIIRMLLVETQQDEMRILGCHTLIDFLNGQTDSTYMSNLDGLIPTLCQLGRQVGEDDRGLSLRSAGLQALASMLHFMGEHSHLSANIDEIASATLQNYGVPEQNLNKNNLDSPCSERLGHGNQVCSLSAHSKSLSPQNGVKIKPESLLDFPKDPKHWSRLCLHNMTALAKEATTARRVLEPIFHYFDTNNLWSSDVGIAHSVLCDVEVLMESGQNIHLILSMLVKHLEHRNVSKQSSIQVKIVNVVAYLAKRTSTQVTVAITAAISDVMRHMRKCMQFCLESSDLEKERCEGNVALYSALDECLVQLMNKVGDVGPILDVMGMFLENIPSSAVASRATMAAVYRAALILASIPNASYHNKEFPEALFHQLLLAMAHADRETRVASHRILSSVLAPDLICPWSVSSSSFEEIGRNPSLTALAALSSSTVILEKMRQKSRGDGTERHGSRVLCSSTEEGFVSQLGKEGSLRLSGHQVDLLLSSVWAQAMPQENSPSNYEAMAHTFSLSLIFAQSKASSFGGLVRCFQLAFSLRRLSLDEGCSLRPSHRRSVFALASSMLLFSAKADDIPQLASSLEEASSDEPVDPRLRLLDDGRLEEACIPSSDGPEDDAAAAAAASRYLSAVQRDDERLKQMVESHLMKRYEHLPAEEDASASIGERLSQPFSAEDASPLGAPKPCDPLPEKGRQPMEKILPVATLEDEDVFPDATGSQTSNKTADDILSADQLIRSVLETARQVASSPAPAAPLPYDEMKSQCEALVIGKQQKMSTLLTFPRRPKPVDEEEAEEEGNPLTLTVPHRAVDVRPDEVRPEVGDGCSSFRLPPSSPFDKFLRAAGVGQQNGVHA